MIPLYKILTRNIQNNKFVPDFSCTFSSFTVFSYVTGKWTNQWACQTGESLQYNLCHDPAHPNTAFFNTTRSCTLTRPFIRHIVSTTNTLIDYLNDEIITFVSTVVIQL